MTLSLTCKGCGRSFEIEGDADNPRLVKMAEVWVRYCPECVERMERLEGEETRRQEVGERRQRTNMPVPLQAVTLDKLDVTPDREAAVAAAGDWGRGDLRGLLLLGDVGLGKTWIAAAAANAYIEQRGELRWYSVAALIAQAMGGFDSDARRQAIAVLTSKTALVLDDLDKVKATDWVASQLFAAIDGRVQNAVPLLVTSNLTADQLQVEYGEALHSRLVAYCEVHELGGEDRRMVDAPQV